MPQPQLYRTRWSAYTLDELATLCYEHRRLKVKVVGGELRVDGVRVVHAGYGRSLLIERRRPRRVSKYRWRKLMQELRHTTAGSPVNLGVSRA